MNGVGIYRKQAFAHRTCVNGQQRAGFGLAFFKCMFIAFVLWFTTLISLEFTALFCVVAFYCSFTVCSLYVLRRFRCSVGRGRSLARFALLRTASGVQPGGRPEEEKVS